MPTLHLDLVEGSQLDTGTEVARAIRQAMVTDITVQPTNEGTYQYDPNVLIKALASAGMPQLNDLHPSISNCRVVRHIVQGIAHDKCRVQIIYETPQTGYIPTGICVIEDDMGLQQEEFSFIPSVTGGSSINDMKPLTVDYVPSGGTKVTKTATYSRLTPIRTLRMSVIQYNRPPEDHQKAVGHVNMTAWGGLGVGFWLCTGISSAYTNTDGTYRYSASFLTHQLRDWKSYAWYYDMFGEINKDITSDYNAGRIRELMAKEYRPGYIAGRYANGFEAFGPYGTADFNRIFGEILPTTRTRSLTWTDPVPPPTP